MSFEAPKVPFAVYRPDPSKLDPEDFVSGELDHGDGGWGVSFDDGTEDDTEQTGDAATSTDDSDWLTDALDDG